MMGALEKIEQEQIRQGDINFRPGDTVRVHVKITEGDKQRIQVYEGVVIALKRGGTRASFTVRKVSYGIGVERIFPVHSPMVDKVEVVARGRVRRAKLYFLRGRRGKAARLKDRDTQRPDTAKAPVNNIVPEPTPA
jgi:large subunit ribosomal protein L19